MGISNEELEAYAEELEKKFGADHVRRIGNGNPRKKREGREEQPNSGGRRSRRPEREEVSITPAQTQESAPAPISMPEPPKERGEMDQMTTLARLREMGQQSAQRVAVGLTEQEVVQQFLEHEDPGHDPAYVAGLAKYFGIKPEHMLGRRELLLELRKTKPPKGQTAVAEDVLNGLCEQASRVGALYTYRDDDPRTPGAQRAFEKVRAAEAKRVRVFKLRVPLLNRETGKQLVNRDGNPAFGWRYYSPAELNPADKTNVLRREIQEEIRRLYHPIAEARYHQYQEAKAKEEEQRRAERQQKREAAIALVEELRSSATLATTITVRGEQQGTTKELRVADIAAIEQRTPGTFFLELRFEDRGRTWYGSMLVEITAEGRFKPVRWTEGVSRTLGETELFKAEGGVEFDAFVNSHRAVHGALWGLAKKQHQTLTGIWTHYDTCRVCNGSGDLADTPKESADAAVPDATEETDEQEKTEGGEN